MIKYLLLLYRKTKNLLGLNSCCRFQPTCSHYFEEAVDKYGFFRGLALFIGRLVRCNGFFKGGVDPVK